jgi:hypothetical protein
VETAADLLREIKDAMCIVDAETGSALIHTGNKIFAEALLAMMTTKFSIIFGGHELTYQLTPVSNAYAASAYLRVTCTLSPSLGFSTLDLAFWGSTFVGASTITVRLGE